MKFKLSRRMCKAAIVLAVFILLGVAFMYGVNYWEKNYNHGSADTDDYVAEDQIFVNEKWYAPKKHLETVLVLGLDKFADENEEVGYINDKQADFIMLIVIDTDSETCKAVQLNRDTMVEIQKLGARGEKAGTFIGQLALAHTYGKGQDDSCRNVVDSVENLLYGIKIDHYVSFTMDSVSEINDIVGGVTVELLEDFTHVSPDYTKGTTVHLMGDMALTYVRGRLSVGDRTNISRMERQKQYLIAFNDKLASIDKDDESLFSDMIEAISKYVVSDCTVSQFSHIYDDVTNYFDGEILSVAGESKIGEKFMEFYVDESALQLQVLDLFYEAVEE